MPQRLVRGVGHEILLRHIGDVFGVGVLGEQMIEGLILVGSDLLGNGAVPLLGIAEGRVHVEDHAAKRIDPVLDHMNCSGVSLIQVSKWRWMAAVMERMSSAWLLVRGILSSLTLTSKQARVPILMQRTIQMRAPTRRGELASVETLLGA